MTALKRISIVGIGKLGAPISACIASKGFRVIGVDSDRSKVRMLQQSKAPVSEPGLEKLLGSCRKFLNATEDLERAVLDTDATFLIVPTPSGKNGLFSTRFVLEAAGRIGRALRKKKGWHLVVLVSTVAPGSIDAQLKPCLEKESGKRCGREFGLCYNPQFVALGSVIPDFLSPDFILIGQSDPKSGRLLAGFYKKTCSNDPLIAQMSFVNAELAKISVNTYITTKISFANMLARICEKLPGANVDVVTGALGLDSRIGKKYLRGAVGYGGPCFPRDNVALAAFAKSIGAPATLAEATDSFNRQEICRLADSVRHKVRKKGSVAILGLAYKPNTDVVEESLGLLLAKALTGAGIPVSVYDPMAMPGARRELAGRTVRFASSARDCMRNSAVVVIATAWEEFRLSPSSFRTHYPSPWVFDCWRILDQQRWSGRSNYLPAGISC